MKFKSIIGALAALAASATMALAQDAVTFRLNWYMGGLHVPFYYGKEKGFYKEEGIDLTINEGRGSANTVQVVAAGSDTFGLADSSSVIATCQTARVTTLPVIVSAVKPGVPFSTRKPLTWPLPIHRFALFSTQASPSRQVLLSSAIEYDPCSGAVSAKAPRLSTRASAGSQRSFCAPEPSRYMNQPSSSGLASAWAIAR